MYAYDLLQRNLIWTLDLKLKFFDLIIYEENSNLIFPNFDGNYIFYSNFEGFQVFFYFMI